LKLPSPAESSQAARYRGRWVPRSRSGLGARRTLDPSGIPDTTRGQGRDSLDDPLLGLGPPTRCFPSPLPAVSRPRAPLWGSSPLQRMRWRESTSSSRWHRPVARSVADGFPAAGYGVAHRFSQPPSDFFLSPPPRHFQAGGAPGVLPYRGFLLSRSPDDSSPPAYLPGLAPASCAYPHPRRGHPRAGLSLS
jgi:hypothetical protein